MSREPKDLSTRVQKIGEKVLLTSPLSGSDPGVNFGNHCSLSLVILMAVNLAPEN